ncbi:MAG: thermonuclease family protein [Pseudomonadota bacterium]
MPVLLLAALVFAAAARAEPALHGPARVVDGDTVKFGAERVRLDAIDAPERAQTCEDAAGATYRCGSAATEALRALIRGRELRCEISGRDVYGRRIGRCTAGGEDLGGRMVALGWALAMEEAEKIAGAGYGALQAEARAARRGLWSGVFRTPAEERAAARRADLAAAPEGCAIKGNISRNGRIYHLPGQSWYARTRINAARGERWFCSEDEAQAAGWRRAKR